jgi:hypothetical protein
MNNWPLEILARGAVLNALRHGPANADDVIASVAKTYTLKRREIIAAARLLCVIEARRDDGVWWTRPNVVAIWWKRPIAKDWSRYRPEFGGHAA